MAVLIHQALVERTHKGRYVPLPAVLAIDLTALLGWLDEGIQWIMPNRIYDIRDVAFNALAALMAIVASLVLERVRR